MKMCGGKRDWGEGQQVCGVNLFLLAAPPFREGSLMFMYSGFSPCDIIGLKPGCGELI